MDARPVSSLVERLPRIAWGFAIGTIVVASLLGFTVLSRYRLDGPPLDLWSAICRGFGITTSEAEPERKSAVTAASTLVVWDAATLDRVKAGDPKRGAFVAMNCVACHQGARQTQTQLIPKLDGLDAATLYKQLDDYRSGRRAWGVMGAIAKALSPQDVANVAAYYAGLPSGRNTAAPLWAGPVPDDAAPRLVVLGDPKRGIAPCAACHGPTGYKQGAPPLAGQHAGYIERQLLAFAQGTRRNDVYATMRTISRALSAEERNEIARYYGAQSTRVAANP